MTRTGRDPGGGDPARAETDKPMLPPGQPTANPLRVEVTGRTPDGIRIDPDLTEGHPGYEEGGDSGVLPPDRLQNPAGQ